MVGDLRSRPGRRTPELRHPAARFTIDVNPVTGRISEFTVVETVKFTDPMGLLSGPGPALNGLNPLDAERIRRHART